MCCAAAAIASAAPGQPGEDADAATPTGNARLLDQLTTCREGILDPTARPTDRRRWVELLFSYDSPEATNLAAELLSLDTRFEVQLAVCEVLSDRMRSGAIPQAAFVDPLVHLLGATEEDLRQAAARVLADLSDGDVPTRLGRIAAHPEEPMTKRLAAIDALAPNVHRRQVVGQLIRLLEAESPEITVRVVAALDPVSSERFGTDLARWRSWWHGQRELSEESWLEQQLQLYRHRARSVGAAFDRFRDRTRRDYAALTTLTRQLQTELYRALPPEQRPRKLVDWLDTSVTTVQTAALEIIKARMADEGVRPEGDVLAALLRVLGDGSSDVRREVLLIVQNLSDPHVVDAVVSQLGDANDPVTRTAVLRALGKLASPRAIPLLIREIESTDACPECVREAAVALGRIAEQSGPDAGRQAVEPLRRRLEASPVEHVALRAALLSAMAGVADPSFAPLFHAALDSDDPVTLQPAIRGVRMLNDTSQTPRLRTLMGHADRLVRLAAIEAVAALGREDADLESILFRLNPANETNELVRAAAWRAFRDFLARRPMPVRVRSSERLRDLPEVEVRYLAELAQALAAGSGDPALLESVLDRLSAGLIAQGKTPEAVPHLRQLFEMRVGRDDSTAWTSGNRWLAAALAASPPRDVADVLRRLHAAADSPAGDESIVQTLSEYLEQPVTPDSLPRVATLLNELRALPATDWPDTLARLIDRVSQQLPPAPESTNSNEDPAPGR